MRNVVMAGEKGKVSVYADRYAIDSSGTIYFLSVCGQTQAVNAVLAGITNSSEVDIQMSGEPVPKLGMDIDTGTGYIKAARRYGKGSAVKSRPISWGRAHGIYVDAMCRLKEVDGDFVVIGDSMEEVNGKIYAVLDSMPIPLLSEWKRYLLDIMEMEGHIEHLETYGCAAARIVCDEEEILRLLSSGIADGTISVSGRKDVREGALPMAA